MNEDQGTQTPDTIIREEDFTREELRHIIDGLLVDMESYCAKSPYPGGRRRGPAE